MGLPLALEFAKKRNLVGFDTNKKRINQLNLGIDKNFETSKSKLKNSKNITFTSKKSDLKFSNCYIITVPTPINKSKKPNLKPLFAASKIVAKYLKKKNVITTNSV